MTEKAAEKEAEADMYDDQYFSQYFDQRYTVSAEPSLHPSALLKKEFGPSIPQQPSTNQLSTNYSQSGAVPYPEGYKKSSASAQSVLSQGYTTASSKQSTASKHGEKQRKIYTVAKDDQKVLKYRKTTVLRQGGGETWDDASLLDWDENDFRIFVGDLGNEVTDEMLYNTFKRYPSMQKARVIRDKRTLKTKGYGFVSFKDPNDFLSALKEMNGKYIGTRPIKLRKSQWQERNVDIKSIKRNNFS